jgi:hypothetical protein
LFELDQPSLGMDREYLVNGIDDKEVQVGKEKKFQVGAREHSQKGKREQVPEIIYGIKVPVWNKRSMFLKGTTVESGSRQEQWNRKRQERTVSRNELRNMFPVGTSEQLRKELDNMFQTGTRKHISFR